MTIKEMQAEDVRKVNLDDLVELTDIVVDSEAPTEERVKEFINQIKNPYCYKINGVVVKNIYNEGGPSLEDCFRSIVETI